MSHTASRGPKFELEKVVAGIIQEQQCGVLVSLKIPIWL
jgi:hypothetical protein